MTLIDKNRRIAFGAFTILLTCALAVWLGTLELNEPAGITPDGADQTDSVAAADGVLPVPGTARSEIPGEVPANERDQGSTLESIVGLPVREDRLVSGRVVDTSGLPLSSVPLVVTAEGKEIARTSSSGVGEFSLQIPFAERATVDIPEGEYTAVLKGAIRSGEGGALDVVVVAGLAIELAGRVVDQEGEGVVGAEIRLELDAGFRARFDVDLGDSITQQWSTVSGSDGWFGFDSVPSMPEAVMIVEESTFRPYTQTAPESSQTNIQIVLNAIRQGDGFLLGRVVKSDGVPATGALVAIGSARDVAASDGRFQLDLGRAEGDLLIAVLAGYQPAELHRTGQAPSPQGWPDGIELVLGSLALEIQGQAVFEDGSPVPGARLSVLDPSYFGWVEQGHGDARYSRHASVEVLATKVSSEDPYGAAIADGAGRFVVGGLRDRDYRLVAVDPKSLAATETGPMRAGTDGAVGVVRRGECVKVAGVVVGMNGEPIEGVLVIPQRTLRPEVEGGIELQEMALGDYQLTSEAGRFEIDRLTIEGITLLVSGQPKGLEAKQLDLSSARSPLSALKIQLAGWSQVQVSTPGNSHAGSFRVFDAIGDPLPVDMKRGEIVFSSELVPIRKGQSEVVTVSERAVEIRVFDIEGVELDRQPARLVPGELIRLEL
jgi:hypothetical protein